MLSPREKKKVEKQCESFKTKYGASSVQECLTMGLQRGTFTLMEYEYAKAYIQRWEKK